MTYLKLTNSYEFDGVIIEVGNDELNVFVPVHKLLLFWTKANVVKFWLFKVKKLTNSLLFVASIVEVGNAELNVFVFIHTFGLLWTNANVVNP